MNKRMLLVVLSLLLAVGCSRTCKVSGRVTYHDGEPVTGVAVIFSTPTYEARGLLEKDGTYEITSHEPGDGVPKGTYNVYFSSDSETSMEVETDKIGHATKMIHKRRRVADPKYCTVDSGITCEVKRNRTFDFQIEKPNR